MENMKITHKHLVQVYQNMKQHLSDEGHVKQVTKSSRKAAIESALQLGISHKEHGELMMKIQEMHRGKKRHEVEHEIELLKTKESKEGKSV